MNSGIYSNQKKQRRTLAELITSIHKEIIERSKDGDSASQYKLYSLYAKVMYNVAYRFMNTKEDAEDMLQDSFTYAFQSLRSFRYESSFGSWIKRIVINRCINEIKRRKADLTFFDDMSYFDEPEGDEKENGYEEFMTVDKIKQAMDFLPNGSKMIFSLYLLEGYDHREISQILKVSESNSKSQYMRAKRKIKEILKEQYNEA